ncbi:MAG: zinc ribbon domain-containing protein [Asgard group archaeon]|nr:zinc ribbon domain-containing protein [Asgard group archaeon]
MGKVEQVSGKGVKQNYLRLLRGQEILFGILFIVSIIDLLLILLKEEYYQLLKYAVIVVFLGCLVSFVGLVVYAQPYPPQQPVYQQPLQPQQPVQIPQQAQPVPEEGTWFCSNCGKEQKRSSKFCSNCGKYVSIEDKKCNVCKKKFKEKELKENLVLIENEDLNSFKYFLKEFNEGYFADLVTFLEDYLVVSFQYYKTIQGILSNAIDDIYFDAMGITKSDNLDVILADLLKEFKTEITGFFDIGKFSAIFISLTAFLVNQSTTEEKDFQSASKLLSILEALFVEMDNFQDSTKKLKKQMIGFKKDATTLTEELYYYKLLISVIGFIVFNELKNELNLEEFELDTRINESLFFIINFSSEKIDFDVLLSLYRIWFTFVRDTVRIKLDQNNESSAVLLLLGYNAMIEKVAEVEELDIAEIIEELFFIISNYLARFHKVDLNEYGGPLNVDYLNEEQENLAKILIDSAFIYFSKNRQYDEYERCLAKIWDFKTIIKWNVKTFLESGTLEKFFFIAALWYDKVAKKPPEFYGLGSTVVEIVRKCTHKLTQEERIHFLKESYHGMLDYTQLKETEIIIREMKMVESYIGSILIGDENR